MSRGRELSREEFWEQSRRKWHPPRWELLRNEDGTPQKSEIHRRLCVAHLLLIARRLRQYAGTNRFNIALHARYLAQDFRDRELTDDDIKSVDLLVGQPDLVNGDLKFINLLVGASHNARMACGYEWHPWRSRYQPKPFTTPQTPFEYEHEVVRLERRIDLLMKKGERAAALAAHRRLLEVAQEAKSAAIWSAADAGILLKQMASVSKEHRARRFGRFRSSMIRNYRGLFTGGPRKEMIRELRSFVHVATEIDAANFTDCGPGIRRIVEWLAMEQGEFTSTKK